MSFMNKLQQGISKAGSQATAFGSDLQRSVGGSQGGMSGITSNFTLEKEVRSCSFCGIHVFMLKDDVMLHDNCLQQHTGFLADPHHPQSALNSIPREVLKRAKGLAIFTQVKAGFVWSGRMGSGVVIARLPDGSWSAPSCIGTGGVGFGLQIGADMSEFVIVLNSEEAVKAFSSKGNLTIGGSLSASAGPIGTGGAVNSALVKPTPMFTYSKSKGLYAGVSLEGTGLVERTETNAAFYGTRIPAKDLLAGKVPPPEAASQLYDIIEAAEALDESGVPQQSYVPSAPPAAGSQAHGQAPIFDANQAH